MTAARETKPGRPTVLHVTECFEGGVGRAIQNIAASATFADHHLLGAGTDMKSDRARALFKSVTELPDGKAAQFRAVHRQLRRVRAEVVHAHSSWAGLYARTARMQGALVYQPHGYAFEMSGRLRGAAFYVAEKMLSMRRQRIVVLSEREGQLATRLSPRAPISLLTNLPTVPEAEASHEWSAPDRGVRIAMNGRVSAQKDPDFFVEVVRELRARGIEAEPIWIGDGEAELRARLEDAGIAVTGWLDSDGIVRELDRCDIYVHTAAYEGFPLSVLDAAARGVPVIARRIHAFDGGPVHQAADAETVATDIERWLCEPGFRRELTAANTRLLSTMNPTVFDAQARALYSRKSMS